MLTWDELQRLELDERLVRWKVGQAETPAGGRALYMLPEVHEAVQQKPWPETMHHGFSERRNRRAAMRAVLNRYTLGGTVNNAVDLKDLGTKRLDESMRPLFAMRSGGPMEQTRLLGFFARPGAFVATSFRARGYFSHEDPGERIKKWQAERVHCEAVWREQIGDPAWLRDPWPVLTNVDLRKYIDRDD